MTRTLRDLGVWADAAALVTTVLAACLLGAVDTVNAHGYVQDVTVDGKLFQGWHPFDDA